MPPQLLHGGVAGGVHGVEELLGGVKCGNIEGNEGVDADGGLVKVGQSGSGTVASSSPSTGS